MPGASGRVSTVVDHRPARCEGCGEELGEDTSTGFSARQVIDLPEITPEVTEHRAHACRWSCGKTTTAACPPTVRAPVSYGPRVQAVVAYLLGRQYIPNRPVTCRNAHKHVRVQPLSYNVFGSLGSAYGVHPCDRRCLSARFNSS